MKKITIFVDLPEKHLITLFTFLGAVLTGWIGYTQHGWVTDDSIIYFEAAKLFAMGQWRHGFELYDWPLYPILLMLIHELTTLTVQQSAQIWNVFFFSLTTYSFLAFIRLAGGDKRTIACGAALLFSSAYIVGDVLPMLLRDEGFWAFFIISLVFLLRFYRTYEFKWALCWQISIFIAMLFRIEALVFLLLTPLYILCNKAFDWKERLLQYSKTQVLSLSASFLFILLVTLSPSLQPADLGRIQEFFTILPRMYAQITQGLVHKSQLMGELILGKYLDDFGLLGICLTLVCITLIKVAGSAGLPAILSLATPQKERCKGLQDDAHQLMLWVMVIGAMNALVMIMTTFILSGRYVIPLAFMLLIMAAFALSNLRKYLAVQDGKVQLQQLLFALIVLLIAVHLIKNILPPKNNHNYEQQAVDWMMVKSAPQNLIFFNSAKLRYYAGQPYTYGPDSWQWTLEAIQNHSIHKHDYLVLSLNGENVEQTKYLSRILTQHKLIKKFSRGPKKVVLIYGKKT